jgi:hypothetical protein
MIKDKMLYEQCKIEVYETIMHEGLSDVRWSELDNLTKLLYNYKLALYKTNTK